MQKYILLLLLLPLSCRLYAQAPGSANTYGGGTSVKSIANGGTSADVAESLYIGPGTHQIDGTWEIYAKNVIVDPAALINGSGTIRLFNPSAAGGAASGSLFDGNNISNNIDVNITLQNASGLVLNNMVFPAGFSGAGWTDSAATSTIYVGKDLNLAVDGADVFLGTSVRGDLRLDADATLSNYRPERMVVTNNAITSHMVKENFTSAFVFPVGMADGDYTPAQISNASATTVSVSVQDYLASNAAEQTADPGPAGVPSDGMNRTWHIYGNSAGTGSTLTLQHNTVTNQSGFNTSNHFVTRWGATVPNTTGDFTVGFGTSAWQTNTGGAGSAGTLTTPAGTVAGSSMRSRNYGNLATSPAAEESYFSKSSDPFHPLPIQLVRFKASARDCDVQINWLSGDESETLQYLLMHSMDGVNYKELSVVAARGDNREYSYLHADAGSGIHYYRLQIKEKEGQTSYSATEVARSNCAKLPGAVVLIYPNPAKEQLVIDNMNPLLTYRLSLMADNGRVVLQHYVQQSSRAVLDISTLPSAPYLMQVQVGAQKEFQYIKVLKL